MSESAPLQNIEQLKEKISSLRESLQKAAPGYETLLHTIHKQLAEDESLVHLLKDEEIGVIVAGLSKRKNIVIAETTKSSGGKRGSKITLDDL